jgi:hypothetical protein
MTAFKKLFLYAFATGIEKLGDSKQALKRIDDILNTPEDVLWYELEQAIQQQHRIKIFEHYGIDMEICSEIDMMGLPHTILEELLDKAIDPRKLKQIINKEIEQRHGQVQGDTEEQG